MNAALPKNWFIDRDPALNVAKPIGGSLRFAVLGKSKVMAGAQKTERAENVISPVFELAAIRSTADDRQATPRSRALAKS